MEIFWRKEGGTNVWWPKTPLPLMPFFSVYPTKDTWVLYLGHPFFERIPIAEVTDVDQPPLEYAEQLWGLYCG